MAQTPLPLVAPAVAVALLAASILLAAESSTMGQEARAPGAGARPLPAACTTPRPGVQTGAVPLAPPTPEAPSDLMSARFAGSSGFYLVTGTAPGPRAGSDPALELELSGPATRTTTEPLSLSLAFRNRSGRPLTVIRPLDGSLEGWREPTYDLYVREVATAATYRWTFVGGRCGNVNPVTTADLVTLSPGARRADVVNGWASYLARATIPRPGAYDVWVVYRFCGAATRGVPLGPDVSTAHAHLGVHATASLRVTVR